MSASQSQSHAEPSYALVPLTHASHTSTSTNSSTSHPVYAGVHDTMRHGLKNVLHQVSTHSHHPVQNRLENWDATRDNLKLTMQRNIHGIGAPAHTLMERKIASYNPAFDPTRSSNSISKLHLDILNGDDELIEPRDFLPSEISTDLADMHTVMERRLGL
ncbi:related to UMP1 - proteasome maturation factor [Melanopsichium pennsylvanicum]|uniref:Related to UMP1 - proteasome maturation factor n=2 Tax=Melanopsichium pennsylvanicum TaxID=63383 RepID=A0AAJ5C4A0_9BASI|nr:related to UMP1-proteasome maturation factor [Melanopsichium pennsylvanicum 4]SNX83417.1 related to UMP1 - proteasome maturation factor [Melanopsichium pennsylvanicum]